MNQNLAKYYLLPVEEPLPDDLEEPEEEDPDEEDPDDEDELLETDPDDPPLL